MKHASLFSGIGGFDLAAEWCGFENIFSVEIDEFCDKVLKKNFPNVRRYYDIKKFNGRKYRGAIDILSGGFPCQPFSVAGKRKGKKDDRFLWQEMDRVISEIKPKWIVIENVQGLLTIEQGLVFEQVLSDLEGKGYEMESFDIPAIAVNAPHKRHRIWIVAYCNSERELQQERIKQNERRRIDNSNKCSITYTKSLRFRRWNGKKCRIKRSKFFTQKQRRYSIRNKIKGCNFIASNSNTKYFKKLIRENQLGYEREKVSFRRCFYETNWHKNWIEVATELCGMDDGVSVELDGYKITKAKHRSERIKSLGNAIVPQVAYQIFMAIKKAEASNE